MDTRTLQHGITEATVGIACGPAHEIFSQLYTQGQPAFLFESKDVSPVYGRLSMIGIDPILKISGKDDQFSIEVLDAADSNRMSRGQYFCNLISDEDLSFCDSFERSERLIIGMATKEHADFEESQRSLQKNISQIIRHVLAKFQQNERSLFGLYGAFSYDFIRLFEDIGDRQPKNNINDFTLFLYDTFIFFDHIKERAEVTVFRNDATEARNAAENLKKKIARQANEESSESAYTVTEPKFVLSQKEYEDLVEIGREQAKRGEIFEIVFSNILKARFSGNPLGLYEIYREKNPSPYLFFVDAGDEQLVGASPEMMVRVEGRVAHMRPIAGTAKRGADPIEDHENMLEILSSEKEKSELDMLIDLGRNDLSRVCKPGVKVTDYRFVEKYSRVMHTVAHVSGELREEYTALDALIACLNAGTLTGAPKVASMKLIEKHEKERRGYYGGAVGYLTFSGEMDTGIIIRTAHIRDGELRFQVGASLLYDSVPAMEYQETINKAQAFLDISSDFRSVAPPIGGTPSLQSSRSRRALAKNDPQFLP